MLSSNSDIMMFSSNLSYDVLFEFVSYIALFSATLAKNLLRLERCCHKKYYNTLIDSEKLTESYYTLMIEREIMFSPINKDEMIFNTRDGAAIYTSNHPS